MKVAMLWPALAREGADHGAAAAAGARVGRIGAEAGARAAATATAAAADDGDRGAPPPVCAPMVVKYQVPQDRDDAGDPPVVYHCGVAENAAAGVAVPTTPITDRSPPHRARHDRRPAEQGRSPCLRALTIH